MTFMLWHSADAEPMQNTIGLAGARRVFRAAEVPVLREAMQALDAIGEQARSHAQRIDDTVSAARQQGYEAGHAKGLEAGQRQAHAQWMQLAREIAAEREQLRGQVAALALAATRKMVGDLGPGERLAAAAAQAARLVLPGEPLEVQVHPSRVAEVERAFAQAPADVAWLASARVTSDAAAGSGDCRLVTAHGSTEVGIDTQLTRLATAWGLALDDHHDDRHDDRHHDDHHEAAR